MSKVYCPVCKQSYPVPSGPAFTCPGCGKSYRMRPKAPASKPQAEAAKIEAPEVLPASKPKPWGLIAGGIAVACLFSCCGLVGLVAMLPDQPKPTASKPRPAAPVKIEAPDQAAAKIEAPASKPEAEEVVTAHQVWADYANTLNAKKLYKGRKYIVIGNVVEVSSTFGKPVVLIRGDEFGLELIRVYLPARLKEQAADLDPGQVIDFYGEVSGSGQLSIRLDATDMGTGPEFAARFVILKK